MKLTQRAYAKLNLTLDILGVRPDGYHEMDMVMQSVSLWDEITLTLTQGGGISLHIDGAKLPTDRNNLAYRAAEVFWEAVPSLRQGVEIAITKRIPVCAGTAGGSSDAAAVLRGLNELVGAGLSTNQLMALGERIGSDVPYCVYGQSARAQGRGEVITPLPPLPDCALLLCKPDFGIETPALFRKWDAKGKKSQEGTQRMLTALESGKLSSVVEALSNDFETVLEGEVAEAIATLKNALLQAGAMGACMSGSGPTVFGIFEGEDAARAEMETLRTLCNLVFFTKPV